MSRSSIRYIDTTYMYGQRVTSNPVTSPFNNSVIYGRFPKVINRKSPIEKINKFLSSILLGLVLLSLVSYYFVSDGQKTMNGLSREIIALSNENIELQNKLDNLHSFNKVDAIIQNNTSLDTAKKVIEMQSVNMAFVPKVQPLPINYNWTIGY